ncbi:peptidase S8 and S53 subtilisin kexin sedolisin [Syncephalis fuscata]|nr:peptidase S8 and S53 subtilisin kexin sedolisin [Syncephalis fuscata]
MTNYKPFFMIMTLAWLMLMNQTWAMELANETQIPVELQMQIDGAYIVKLRSTTNANEYLNRLSANQKSNLDIQHIYSYGEYQGFASKLSYDAVRQLQRDPDVEYVEPQRILHITGQQENPPNWGLSRIANKLLNLDLPYIYPDSAGAGIDVWILDTGIMTNHTEFEGRASMSANFVNKEEYADLNGHGTHVAGIVGSKTYGVAKKATILGVKVLNRQGLGIDANIIAGIQHAVKHARPNKSVVNMSFVGSKSEPLDDAVNAAVSSGVPFIVAAGNGRQNACNSSPSGASKVFAVAASNNKDQQAQFSSYGKCAKLYAPGTAITSLWIGDDNATSTASGTSMAAPHVAGVAAVYLATNDYRSVDDLYNTLINRATPGMITRTSPGAINKIVFIANQ